MVDPAKPNGVFDAISSAALELREFGEIEEIVSGTATGVDTLGELWAAREGLPVCRMPARWKVNGKLDRGAGPKRNFKMAKYVGYRVGGLILIHYGPRIKPPTPGSTNMFGIAQDFSLHIAVRYGIGKRHDKRKRHEKP